jgi:competence protein ComFC
VSLFGSLLDLIYPRVCLNCGQDAGPGSSHICWDCAAAFSLVEDPFCSRCGDPVDGRVENVYQCSFCRRDPPHFDLARSALRYRGGVRDAIHAMKYHCMPCLSGDLARWLVACYRLHYSRLLCDAVACVPLHSRRHRERTYNQAALLASALARELHIPLALESLRRVKATDSQISLNARQRRANVRGAFSVTDGGWVEGRRLLLVDDVMTTGATVDECARVLKEAGAAAVYVLTVARG